MKSERVQILDRFGIKAKAERLKLVRAEIQTVKSTVFGLFPILDVRFLDIHCILIKDGFVECNKFTAHNVGAFYTSVPILQSFKPGIIH